MVITIIITNTWIWWMSFWMLLMLMYLPAIFFISKRMLLLQVFVNWVGYVIPEAVTGIVKCAELGENHHQNPTLLHLKKRLEAENEVTRMVKTDAGWMQNFSPVRIIPIIWYLSSVNYNAVSKRVSRQQWPGIQTSQFSGSIYFPLSPGLEPTSHPNRLATTASIHAIWFKLMLSIIAMKLRWPIAGPHLNDPVDEEDTPDKFSNRNVTTHRQNSRNVDGRSDQVFTAN